MPMQFCFCVGERVNGANAVSWQAYFLLQEGGNLDPAHPIPQSQQQTHQQPTTTTSTTIMAGGKPPTTGTISGMLADFSKALGEFLHFV